MSAKAETAKIRELRRIRLLEQGEITVGADFRTWLKEEALKLSDDNSKEVYLLSFHDDGVVWGKVNGIDLLTSADLPDTPSPEFRKETLQECRAFSTKGEVLIWRVGENQFKARLVEDIEDESQEENCFDENQVLWGTQAEGGNDEFTIVADGSEGLRHAFPMRKSEIETKFSKNPKELKRPLRLCARHYLKYDQEGCAYVWLSRLVQVNVE